MLNARYAVGDVIGRGAFGQVYRCVDVRTGSTLAVKVLQTVRQRETRERTLRKIHREIDMHRLLSDCPHVAKYVDSFEDADQAGIAMEYCGGPDLDTYVAHHGTLSDAQVAGAAAQVLRMLRRCHSKGIVFSDVKPANLCVCSPDAPGASDAGAGAGACAGAASIELKVVDFGCARAEREDTDFTGTPAFMSPEALARDFSYKTDVWSLGVTLYWLYTGEFPCWDTSSLVVSIDYLREAVRETPVRIDRLSGMSPEGLDFVMRCLAKKTTHRQSVEEAMAHPFVLQPRRAQ